MEQLTHHPTQRDIHVLGRCGASPLVGDPFHFGVEDLMEVMAKRHDAGVGTADALLFLEAARRLPDQATGLVQSLQVGPRCVNVH